MDHDDVDADSPFVNAELPEEGGMCGWWHKRSIAVRVGIVITAMGALAGIVVGLTLAGETPSVPISQRPVVINTWFVNATATAWTYLNASYSALDSLEYGCRYCEDARCDGTVGPGGSPDENGETTLDALVMDGAVMDVAAVGYLRRIPHAISAARKVLHYTTETLLAGDGATNFSMWAGEVSQPLYSNESISMWQTWKATGCPNNYYQAGNVNETAANCPQSYVPVPTPSYTPMPAALAQQEKRAATSGTGSGGWLHGPRHAVPSPSYPARSPRPWHPQIDRHNHDTLGMCTMDVLGQIAAGVTSNGARFKIPGRIGDAPMIGAGSYASDHGCAAATGDGDITSRFLPAFVAVEAMRNGMSPGDACAEAVRRIIPYYPRFQLGLVCMDKFGNYGAAAHDWTFTFAVAAPDTGGQAVAYEVQPIQN